MDLYEVESKLTNFQRRTIAHVLGKYSSVRVKTTPKTVKIINFIY